jgi:hypothetical protein
MSDKKLRKIVLVNERHQVLRLPRDAKILTVQIMPSDPPPGNDICLWAMGERGEIVERHIGIAEAGDTIPSAPSVYIGTFQNAAQTRAFHVFELTAQRR